MADDISETPVVSPRYGRLYHSTYGDARNCFLKWETSNLEETNIVNYFLNINIEILLEYVINTIKDSEIFTIDYVWEDCFGSYFGRNNNVTRNICNLNKEELVYFLLNCFTHDTTKDKAISNIPTDIISQQSKGQNQ